MVLPLELMEGHLGKRVSLLLKDGRRMEGTLSGVDPHMNLVLEDAEESAADGARGAKLGTVLLRGNNLISLAPQG